MSVLPASSSRQLVIMRHGEAAPFESAGGDFARPLERRGIVDVGTIARRLRDLPWRPDAIVASTARRTQETARAFAAVFKIPETEIVAEARLYNADLDTWQIVARELDVLWRRVVLVGHNPGVSEFAQWLLPSQRVDGLTPGTSLLLDCQIESWSDLTPARVARLHRSAPR